MNNTNEWPQRKTEKTYKGRKLQVIFETQEDKTEFDNTMLNIISKRGNPLHAQGQPGYAKILADAVKSYYEGLKS